MKLFRKTKKDKRGNVLKPVTIFLADEHLARFRNIATQHDVEQRHVIELSCIKGADWVSNFFTALNHTKP